MIDDNMQKLERIMKRDVFKSMLREALYRFLLDRRDEDSESVEKEIRSLLEEQGIYF